MASFLFDFTLNATARVEAETEEQARAAIMAELECYGPVATITARDGVTLELSEISPATGPEALELAEVDGVVPEPARTFAHQPEACPSNHWNGGDDICADCGEDLA